MALTGEKLFVLISEAQFGIDQLANLHFHFTSVPLCTPMVWRYNGTPMEILHLSLVLNEAVIKSTRSLCFEQILANYHIFQPNKIELYCIIMLVR